MCGGGLDMSVDMFLPRNACAGQKTTYQDQFSSSTMHVPEIALSSTGLATSSIHPEPSHQIRHIRVVSSCFVEAMYSYM